MILATKTLEAIEAALSADQGSRYRGLLRELMPTAEDAYRENEDGFRSHLGASLIGRECARELWYTFRWAQKSTFEGRMLRLFNRGHLEEPRLVALLRMIGCRVWQHTDSGTQYRVSGCGGHFGGSLDAVITGLPDISHVAILGEFKTHNAKSFEKLKKEGVLKAKWEHYVQQQVYMGKMNLPWSLYLATCKDTDELWGELIEFNPGQYDRYNDRARMVVEARNPPPRISETPGFFKCKFCSYYNLCHLNEQPLANCRTCAYSVPAETGVWGCSLHGKVLQKEEQFKGCNYHRPIPMG